MTESGNHPFAGLPSSLVCEIIRECPSLAAEALGPVKAAMEARESMRAALTGNGMLHAADAETPAVPTCGIDGRSGSERVMTSDIAWCAAFGAEGLTDGGQAMWNAPVHRIDIFPEEPSADVEPLLGGLLSQRIVETSAAAPHEIILAGDSFARLFARMMNGLQPAMRSREAKTAKAFVAGLKPALAAFDAVSGDNAGHAFVGVTSGGFGGGDGFREIAGALNRMRRSLLFTILLEPGEFAGPSEPDNSPLDAVRSLPIKDGAFAGLRDRIADGLAGRRIVFFRAGAWTPAIMLDVPASIAGDAGRLSRLIGGIGRQCSTPGITMPFPLYLAGRAAIEFGRAAPAIRNTVLSTVAGMFGGGIGTLLPFMQANDSTTGDDHE